MEASNSFNDFDLKKNFFLAHLIRLNRIRCVTWKSERYENFLLSSFLFCFVVVVFVLIGWFCFCLVYFLFLSVLLG